MAVTDADFALWLRADNKERTVLMEADAYSGGAVVTRYASNRGFTSAAADTPANTAYDDILVDVPSIRSAMAEVFRGRSLVSFGDVQIDNSSGVRDAWLQDAWDGRPVKLYLGDPAWPKSDFRLVFFGTTEDISASDNRTITLRVRDRQHLLAVPLQVNRIGGTDPSKQQRYPVCYGQCLSVEPILVDSATRKYALHDSAIQSIDAVYVDGVATAAFTATISGGYFTMNSAVTGRITVDCKGANATAYFNTTASLIKRIITDRTSLTAADIDTSSVTALDAAAPGVVGFYSTDDAATVLTALDELATGAGAYYAIGRDGKVTMALFTAATGAPTVALTDDDVELARIELTRRITPLKSVRLGYARYHTTINSGAASSLTEAQRERLTNEYLIAYQVTTAAGFLLAIDGDVNGTCYLNSSDAVTEAARRATLWGALRYVYRIGSFMTAQQVKLGDVVSLDFSRFGLSGGVLARVVGLRESITGGSVEIEVFI